MAPPKKPKTYVVAPGNMVIDKTGKRFPGEVVDLPEAQAKALAEAGRIVAK